MLKKPSGTEVNDSSAKVKPVQDEETKGKASLKHTVTKRQTRKLANWKIMLPVVLVIVFLVWLGLKFDIDKLVIAGAALIFAILSGVFTWIVGIIMLVPFIGPLIIKVLSIPLVWLINGIGYLVSYTAIKRGYSKDVLTYRGLTITLIIGIVIGFIIAHLISR